MKIRWAGPLITLFILGGVGAVLLLNLESPKPPSVANAGNSAVEAPAVPAVAAPPAIKPGGFREYPIGETEKNHMRISAVWLPSIHMEGMPTSADPDVIHLEADIKSLEKNPNGFAEGEFVPYLTIKYRIQPFDGGEAVEGTMMPMIASDGLHYGASISLPKRGDYRLVYEIQPPSSGGLGRHDDPQTGVAPWWEPFKVTFPWKYEGVPPTSKGASPA